MAGASILILCGFVLLYFGAEGLVRGAARLSIAFGVTPLVVGLTVVSLSTSMPEAMTSFLAQFQAGSGDLALGNIVGSNIANIGLILGVAALVRPLNISSEMRNRETPFMAAVTVGLLLLMFRGETYRYVGFGMLALLVAYLYFQVFVAHKIHDRMEKEGESEEGLLGSITNGSLVQDVAYILVGTLVLVLGGHCLVKGAIGMARIFEISDRVIAVSVVAFGTSLPELATSIVAGLRGESDIAIGNVIGSNIFNILFIVGGVTAILPFTFSRDLLTIDGVVMLGFTLLLWGIVTFTKRVTRPIGALLITAYASYIYSVF